MDNATLTGLIPFELKDKYESLNNSSLLGTVKYALGKNDLSRIENAEYEDMSQSPLFSDLFIKNMEFNEV
jgi:hypothetical protein